MTTLLRIIAGLGGWALGFSLLYALHGIGCARHWPAIAVGPVDLQHLVLAFVWIAACLVLGLWLLVQVRAPHRAEAPLLGWLIRASAITGLVAMVVSGLPVVLTRPCAAPGFAMEPERYSGLVSDAQRPDRDQKGEAMRPPRPGLFS